MSDIHTAMSQAEQRWGIPFKRKTAKEASSSCPFCHAGKDRFLVFADNGYWCRQCDARGWLDDNESLSPTEKRLRRLEWEQTRAEIERREMSSRIVALEEMAKQADLVDLYHANLNTNESALDHWHEHYGASYNTIAERKLGYCLQCPTATFSDSLTIPVWYQGTLRNIRHRLLKPNGGKYRPHLPNLGAMLFNQDDLHADSNKLLILEGEVKSIILSQETERANVAVMGKSGFPESWARDKRFDRFPLVYVCFDPDAHEQAVQTAQLFGKRGRVMGMPHKADEFFYLHNGTADDFRYFVNQARPV